MEKKRLRSVKDNIVRLEEMNECAYCDFFLSEVDMEGRVLSHGFRPSGDLIGADLTHARLTAANLANINLSRTELTGADLRGALLSGANLSQANLLQANLSSYPAFFPDSNIKKYQLRTNLADANLDGANLDGVIFCNTTMPDRTINNSGC